MQGAPGDLLLLAGFGFSPTDTVFYQQVADTTQPLTPPAQPPYAATSTSGTLPVVSSLAVPDSLTVSLPTSMQTDVSYAVWVMDAAGEWSNGVLINDARPLWVTPDTVYASAAIAGLPREVKIVGRNLQPAPSAVTQVWLCGPVTVTLTAANDNDPGTAIEKYVAKVELPTSLPPGTYSIQVSRDATSWTSMKDRKLTVLPDPRQPAEFAVASYGGCLPDDAVDDTPCIAKAIAAARASGGGAVSFGPGVWDMNYAGARSSAGPVTITGNTIVQPFNALADGGMPIDHLLVTNSDFGAHANALSLIGDGTNVNQAFVVADTVIAYNTFEPGSYTNPPHNTVTHADGLHGGAIALTRGWYAGPSPGNWNLEDNTLVFANTIDDIGGAASQNRHERPALRDFRLPEMRECGGAPHCPQPARCGYLGGTGLSVDGGEFL